MDLGTVHTEQSASHGGIPHVLPQKRKHKDHEICFRGTDIFIPWQRSERPCLARALVHCRIGNRWSSCRDAVDSVNLRMGCCCCGAAFSIPQQNLLYYTATPI
jgi:hypothetical protein